MHLQRFFVEGLAHASYLFGAEGEAAVVDPKRDVDLIVTSTHGHTGFMHVLVGSVAEDVVRRAHLRVVRVGIDPARQVRRHIPGPIGFHRLPGSSCRGDEQLRLVPEMGEVAR